jgi:site-specific DNA-methyltransferase (adenine-specific)
MTAVFERKVSIGPCKLYCGDCFDILPSFDDGSLDAVITDPPFSERMHSGHDRSSSRLKNRHGLGYECWSVDTVSTFADLSISKCGAWIVVLSDHILFPKWWKYLRREERITFPPLPFFDKGRSCRFSGDGPCSWTTWIIVSRTKAQYKWGTLPGGYVKQQWYGQKHYEHIGGKPVGLMELLVKDYSREGNMVCDPCMGSGTTGIACIRHNRKFIGIEKNREFFDKAVERIRREYEHQQGRLL